MSSVKRKPRKFPLSAVQQRILAYLRSVERDGICRVKQEEVATACGAWRSVVVRAMASLQKRGLITIEPVRATFVTFTASARNSDPGITGLTDRDGRKFDDSDRLFDGEARA